MYTSYVGHQTKSNVDPDWNTAGLLGCIDICVVEVAVVPCSSTLRCCEAMSFLDARIRRISNAEKWSSD